MHVIDGVYLRPSQKALHDIIDYCIFASLQETQKLWRQQIILQRNGKAGWPSKLQTHLGTS
jgi:hypothetical protein